MKWLTIILGVVLVQAPFAFGYNETAWALWTSLILGAAIAVLGFKHLYKATAIAGLVVFVAPWILGFSGVSSAAWSCWLLGGAVALLAGYLGFFAKLEDQADSAQSYAA